MYPYYYYVTPTHPAVYVNHYPTVHYSPPYYSNSYYLGRNYPQVNPSMLMKSANKMQNLVKDAMLVLGKISVSKQFSIELMSAAQQSNKGTVERLIRSAGVKNFPEITYTPVGINLKFHADVGKIDCCHLKIDLRWE